MLYLPQAQVPIDSFGTREAIVLCGRVRGGDPAAVARRADALIEALDLGEWRNKRGIRLSGGVKRLVGFAMVIVCPGRVAILDEPANDVDPLRRGLLWQQIRELGNLGVAVFLVTHNVLEAEKAVDRLAIIDRGRQRKVAGTWDFIWSLPAPRSAAVASTFTAYTAMTIPGIVATLALAAWRYGLHLSVSPMAVPAFILASLAATSAGFGMALAIRDCGRAAIPAAARPRTR